uniref:NADH-ubiquinone oxidoreductase chain 2 n=1 Tax=Zele chlorophthalmus TaxID=1080924 RepID=A0A345X0Q8_ZELCH|nr:NADH dehydrogenase subunit 2 [Zele chlorophthalmus]AXK15300.1 NADH dehydrogenase subunit 2 [Zele chlorophthalmus]
MLDQKFNLPVTLILFSSPMLVLSMNSLISMWMCMEINTLMFILLIILNNKDMDNDSSMKYFLISCFSSTIFILSFNMNLFYSNTLFIYIMNLMMIMKLGIFPFHYWFIDLMIKLNWLLCLILSTWQKIIPFFILLCCWNKNLMIIFLIMNGFLSMMFGMNQTSLKKILAYSSINHMSWMILMLMINKIFFFAYLMIYSLINSSMMYLLNFLNLKNFFDLFKFKNKFLKFYLMFLLFSLGGLPPFFGFISKWISMFEITSSLNFFTLLILLFYSLIFLSYYIRFMYWGMLMNYSSIKEYSFMFNLNFLNNMKLYNLITLFCIFNLFSIMFWFFF